jgi:hypothetical protein
VIVTQRSTDLLAVGSPALAAQVGGLQLAFLIAAAVSLAAAFVAVIALKPSEAGGLVATAASELAA